MSQIFGKIFPKEEMTRKFGTHLRYKTKDAKIRFGLRHNSLYATIAAVKQRSVPTGYLFQKERLMNMLTLEEQIEEKAFAEDEDIGSFNHGYIQPKQGLYEIWEKFRLYFELGVQSCWLVELITRVVTVYSSSQTWQAFSSADVIDQKLGIRIPINEIFA